MFTAANESTNWPVTEPATEPSKLAPLEATRRTSAGVDISAKLALNELIALAKRIRKPGAPARKPRLAARPLPQAGEGAIPGPLSRERERVGVRVFAYRQGFVSREGDGSNSQGLRLKLLSSREVCSSVGTPEQLDERKTRLSCMAMESVGNVTKYLVQHPVPAALV